MTASKGWGKRRAYEDAPGIRLEPTPRDQRDRHVMAHRIIDDLSGPDARLILAHLADENLPAFWSAYGALGLEVMSPGRSG